jgi:ubiquitin-activating enzyme E1 C
MVESENVGKKWNYLKKILERSGPFDTEMFTPSSDTLEFLQNTCKILVIGKLHKIM